MPESKSCWSTTLMTSSSANSRSCRIARLSARRPSLWRLFGETTHHLKSFTMPRLKLTLPTPSTPWTKVPNVLLDRLLPTLKDTELRVLLLLIRQTSGWNHEDRAVMLSYRSLIQRTGRKSEALSHALRALKQRGLIHTVRAFAHSSSQNSEKGHAENRSATLDRKRYKDRVDCRVVPPRRDD